ncbi:MAG: protease inhibitor I42 family protein [Dehalococcoidales bacterium]|nr:MAG: protease inhibitor I42 family protein [Dehalococcoidales bacterium]
MKARLTLIGVLAIASIAVTLLALSAGGINPAAAEGEGGQIGLDASYNGQEIEAAAGKRLVITLESNPTTGFGWQLSEPIDEGLLALIESRYEPGENAQQGMVGAGGSEVWTFETLATGETTISMEYSRPWEGGEEAVETFEITVIIK